MINTAATIGILNPDDPEEWLVPPWSEQAGFCDVVQHFVYAYVRRVWNNTSAAGQLAYFEGYRAALEAASTDDLVYEAAWDWRDDLLDCIARCVTAYQDRCGAGSRPRTGAISQAG